MAPGSYTPVRFDGVAIRERADLASGRAGGTLSPVRDTSPAADERYHELLRALPPHARLESAMRLSQAVRVLAEQGIRQRHPSADDDEVRVRLTVRLYGRAAAVKLFGSVPDDAV
jgi:hypothetical protein